MLRERGHVKKNFSFVVKDMIWEGGGKDDYYIDI